MSSEKNLSAEQELESVLKDLISTRTSRRIFLASVPLLMAACATRSQHRMREGDNTGQHTDMSVADEQKLTQEALPEMRKDYPPLENADMQNYISALGQKIVRANGLHAKPYTYSFTVVGVPYVNAFALPAGTVFVTAPLIDMAETEAELAGVLGHEIGHIKARHTAERMQRAKEDQNRGWLYAVGGGLLGAGAGFGLGKLICKKEDKSCLAKAAGLGAAAGAGGGFLISKYAFMANSQEDEMEADRIGFRTSVQAGYSKDAVGNFYAKLLRMEEEHKRGNVPLLSSITDAMSTHPPSRERVTQMEQMARETRLNPSAVTSTKTFDKVRALASEWTKSNRKS